MNAKESIFSIIKKYSKSKHKYLIPCLILQVIVVLTSLVPIYSIWKIIISIFFYYPIFEAKTIMQYLFIAVITQILSICCAFIASIMAHIIAFEVENGLREVSFTHLLELPVGYFQANESGRLRKIIDDNASLTHSFIAHQLPDLIPGFLIPLIVLISMFIVDFRFGLVLIFCLILAMLMLKTSFSPTNNEKMKEYQYALENINTEGVEYFRGIPVVKVFQQSVLSFNRFYKVIKDYEKYCLDYTINFRNPYLLTNIALYLPYMLIGIVAIILLTSSNNPLILITNAIFYILIALILNMSLMRLLKLATGINNLNLAIGKINEILQLKPLEINDETKNKEVDKSSIVLDNISFSYDKKRVVVEEVSFEFEEGKSYGLVGKSGSGKSTLINLIARFYDVDKGNIYLDGVNVKSLSENEIFEKISIVFQKQKLLKDTVFENIRMYDSTKTEEDVKKALEKANGLEIIDNLEKGIFTNYGSQGTYFSGGEIQRIVLARAFLKDYPILLLDEALAFIDVDNEHEILEAINKLKQDKTTIMILHRLNSVKSFDEIIMLDDGKIISSGPHEVLINECEKYKKLYQEYQKTVKWRVKNV